MRTRIITSPSFRDIERRPTADYFWNVKRVVPFLKVDKGLAPERHGVQLMKPIPALATSPMMRYEKQAIMQAPLAAPTIGRSFPIGATLAPGGANFSIFSRSAARIELLFFDRADDGRPSRVIPIYPAGNHTYHYWHVFVPGVEAGQIYGFRAYGPFEPARGLRFDPSKLLLDPYGRAVVVRKNYSRDAARLKATTPQQP
jgi:hypothetical protein